MSTRAEFHPWCAPSFVGWIKGGIAFAIQPQPKAGPELIPITNRDETPDSDISSMERNLFDAPKFCPLVRQLFVLFIMRENIDAQRAVQVCMRHLALRRKK